MLLKTLANASSCNSATRLSHFLCFDRCFFLHAALQYFTNLHLLQVFTLPPSLPQLAHFDKVDASLLLPCAIILLFWGILLSVLIVMLGVSEIIGVSVFLVFFVSFGGAQKFLSRSKVMSPPTPTR